jgi:hypothetical protein
MQPSKTTKEQPVWAFLDHPQGTPEDRYLELNEQRELDEALAEEARVLASLAVKEAGAGAGEEAEEGEGEEVGRQSGFCAWVGEICSQGGASRRGGGGGGGEGGGGDTSMLTVPFFTSWLSCAHVQRPVMHHTLAFNPPIRVWRPYSTLGVWHTYVWQGLENWPRV